jgi:hypothetical protein
MKIIKLTSQNVKRLSAVEITPTGDLVVIGGANDAGKSSVLDSIMYAMAGGDSLPQKPVRRGATKAKVQLDLGDLIVTRTFTAAGGTSLTVQGKDGKKYGSPQAVLNALTGRLSFDPLDFSRQDPKVQAEILRSMVGLDFKDLDSEYSRLFGERTISNRRVAQCQAALAAMPPAGEPTAPVSIAALVEELKKTNTHNQANKDIRTLRNNAEERLKHWHERIGSLKAEIDRLQKQLVELEANLQSDQGVYNDLSEQLAQRQDIDPTPIQQAIAEAEQTNQRHNQALIRGDAERVLKEAQAEAEALTRALESNRETKAKKIQGAKFPIPGLALGDEGVTLDGIPLNQASSSGRLKVSVAIGLALNPRLKVLLIRDGSLLDDNSMKLVAEMAAQADAQVWIERVEDDKTVSVVIEDGHVKGQEAPDFAAEKPESDLQNVVIARQNGENVTVQARIATEPPPED